MGLIEWLISYYGRYCNTSTSFYKVIRAGFSTGVGLGGGIYLAGVKRHPEMIALGDLQGARPFSLLDECCGWQIKCRESRTQLEFAMSGRKTSPLQ